MHDDSSIIEQRLPRVRRDLISPNRWRRTQPFEVTKWTVPDDADGHVGEPVPASVALAATYEPAGVGAAWGRPWGTTWFHLTATVPTEWAGSPVDVAIDLGFGGAGPGFTAEGMIWTLGDDGELHPERGVHPFAHRHRRFDLATGGEVVDLWVEGAANPIMHYPAAGSGDANSDRLTAGASPIYSLRRLELAIPEVEVDALHHDVRAVVGIMREQPAGSVRRREIVVALGEMMDALDARDVVGSAPAARAALAPVLARPAAPSALRVSAIGHAHIDSAWLWPLRETHRKCARTFANVLRLMEQDPRVMFACSQAAQYEWVRDEHPELFEQIRARVAEGRWVPVGGNWVEADGNISGGESMVRQFVHGQRFFREHFGVTCHEQWIPDVFGYPASFPQIYRLGGAERFLTQKLSWNRTNRFPHHTFWWEGIDGSRVFTHFPPVDTYNAGIEPFELAKIERQFAEVGKATRSLMPFGFGDGGGGPNADMMTRFDRLADVEGLPRLEIESPASFFDKAIEEYPDAPVWVGELYFEMHRGTYTSQARTKAGNRRCERLLREAELWSISAFGAGERYPAAQLDRIWKTVLLLQFHDILPGSSIGWVHREAEQTYAELEVELEELIAAATSALAPIGPTLLNPAPHARDEVVAVVADVDGPDVQRLADGRVAFRAAVPALGVAPAEPLPVAHPVIVSQVDGSRSVIDNGVLRAEIDTDGLVVSVVHVDTGRELLSAGGRGALVQLHHDLPFEYDAWDIEEYYRHRGTDLVGPEFPATVTVLDAGPVVARVEVRRPFRDSSITQVVELRADSGQLDVSVELDWHERDHLLKIAWPFDIQTTDVVRQIQYGHLKTPIHTNTSWDHARFEVCAHQWIDVGEPGFGVALVGDTRYGYDVTRTRSDIGMPSTTARITAVKGARFPDPQADVGHHEFRYAVLPHAGHLRKGGVVAEGYRFNHPVRVATGSAAAPAVPWVAVDHDAVIVEAVKAAEDGSGDVVVRIYESYGGRASATLRFAGEVANVRRVDLLEDERDDLPPIGLEVVDRHSIRVALRPFQIATLRLSPA